MIIFYLIIAVLILILIFNH